MTRVIDDPLYGVWETMKQRCYNPKNHKYKNYGQRGITVSDLWKKSFKDFRKWAVANCYHKGLTFDRINTYGNYDPSNCRWVNQKVQQNNRRNNHVVDGKTIAEWAEKSKFSYTTVLKRINLYHMKPKDAISVPDKHMILVTINGVTKNLTEWSKVYGVSMSTASARIARGWNPIKAVTTPARKFRHAN